MTDWVYILLLFDWILEVTQVCTETIDQDTLIFFKWFIIDSCTNEFNFLLVSQLRKNKNHVVLRKKKLILTSSTIRNTSPKKLGLELHQNRNAPRKHVREIVNWTERKRLRVRMIMRVSKRLWVNFKRKKPWMNAMKKLWMHVAVILVFMNDSFTTSKECDLISVFS